MKMTIREYIRHMEKQGTPMTYEEVRRACVNTELGAEKFNGVWIIETDVLKKNEEETEAEETKEEEAEEEETKADKTWRSAVENFEISRVIEGQAVEDFFPTKPRPQVPILIEWRPTNLGLRKTVAIDNVQRRSIEGARKYLRENGSRVTDRDAERATIRGEHLLRAGIKFGN